MTIFKIYRFVLIAILFYGCVDPFQPDIPDSQEDFLVVDGTITDQEGPYEVRILKSSSLNEENEFVSGVQVSIEAEDGGVETLQEIRPGIYHTSSLRGEVGKSYRLNLEYQGDQYQSTWETLYASPAIDSIYYQVEVRGTTDRNADQSGVQFFIDNHGDENGVRHFRYEWIETWQLGVTWRSANDYLGNDETEPTSNPLWRCWKTDTSSSINIGTTEGLSKNILSGHRLDFIPSSEERFLERYSLLLRQYALSEEEYTFWKRLQESNEELGNLFDTQPANVKGNISGITNPGDLVLGYFSAAGSQEQRIYLSASELPDWFTQKPGCDPLDSLIKSEFIPSFEYEIYLNEQLDRGWFFYAFITPLTSSEVLGALLSTPKCSDCTLKGGDLNKPDFWDE